MNCPSLGFDNRTPLAFTLAFYCSHNFSAHTLPARMSSIRMLVTHTTFLLIFLMLGVGALPLSFFPYKSYTWVKNKLHCPQECFLKPALFAAELPEIKHHPTLLNIADFQGLFANCLMSYLCRGISYFLSHILLILPSSIPSGELGIQQELH